MAVVCFAGRVLASTCNIETDMLESRSRPDSKSIGSSSSLEMDIDLFSPCTMNSDTRPKPQESYEG